MAGAIVGSGSVDNILQAIPVIGELIAVLTLAGTRDVGGGRCTESAMFPWVIENEVSLTYAATVTINHATNDATFPRTATSYSLTAQVDGSKVLDPINGTVTQGQSAPVVVQVPNAPFGGKEIQWSVVFSNAAGQQVGTGASPKYTNDDPSNPPSAVAITITEIPVPITATTVFERSDTTGYSSAAGGYTWSSQIPETGTVMSRGIQRVTGVTVSTLAGVAGVVWEQGNQFYGRGSRRCRTARRSRWARRASRGSPAARFCCSTRLRRQPMRATTSCSPPTPHPGLPRPQGHARPDHWRAHLGPYRVLRHLPTTRLSRDIAFVGSRGRDPYRQRPVRMAKTRANDAAPGAGRLQRRFR